HRPAWGSAPSGPGFRMTSRPDSTRRPISMCERTCLRMPTFHCFEANRVWRAEISLDAAAAGGFNDPRRPCGRPSPGLFLEGRVLMFRRLVAAMAVGLLVVSGRLWADVPGLKKPSFDSGGVKIHYVVQGKEDGEPVLLIHGFTVDIPLQWTPVIKALEKDYKV